MRPVWIALLLVCSWPALACELDFAYTNQPSPPFITAAAPDEAMPGLAVEIVRAAAQSLGCKVRWHFGILASLLCSSCHRRLNYRHEKRPGQLSFTASPTSRRTELAVSAHCFSTTGRPIMFEIC